MKHQGPFTHERISDTELISSTCKLCGLIIGTSSRPEVLSMVERVHLEHRHSSPVISELRRFVRNSGKFARTRNCPTEGG